jgi:hypothetical protein
MSDPEFPYDRATPEHVEAIGLIIMNWANAEHVLAHVLARLLGDRLPPVDEFDGLRLVAITGMRDRPVAALTKSIFRLRYSDLADRFDKLIDSLLREGKRRDVIAHAVWNKGNRAGSIRTGVARPSNVFKLEEFEYTAAELRRLANRIYDKTVEIVSFLKPLGFFGGLPPSPETPP